MHCLGATKQYKQIPINLNNSLQVIDFKINKIFFSGKYYVGINIVLNILSTEKMEKHYE